MLKEELFLDYVFAVFYLTTASPTTKQGEPNASVAICEGQGDGGFGVCFTPSLLLSPSILPHLLPACLSKKQIIGHFLLSPGSAGFPALFPLQRQCWPFK